MKRRELIKGMVLLPMAKNLFGLTSSSSSASINPGETSL